MYAHDAGRLDRLLFSRSRLLHLVVIVGLSFLFSYLLTGRQIQSANWGLIDDSEIFSFLGPSLHLSASDIWSTLVNKTEVGQLLGRFRPTYYVVKITEAWLFGPNVHLWYLVVTACFALFLSAVWWTVSRFVGLWLGGALVAYIALLPLWAHVWSRLGPSEIFGASSVAVMLFASDAVLFGDSPWIRNGGAVVLTLVAISLAGLKETFLPIAAGGPGFVFVLAAIRKRIPVVLAATLASLIVACLAALSYVVFEGLRAAGSVDYYGKPAGPGPTLLFSFAGVLDAFLRTWWIWILPILFFQRLNVLPTKTWREWIAGSGLAFATYAFLVAMYAAQCGLYRMLFPHNSRYDFPAMLLVPFTFCILACEVFRQLRGRFDERVVQYAELNVAGFVVFALVIANVGARLPLAMEVKKNIEFTNAFFNEVQRASRAARDVPRNPIIIEAYGPKAYEGVFAVPDFLRALGSINMMSVRFHPDAKAGGPLDGNLQKDLSKLEAVGNDRLAPLAKSLASRSEGCLSIGLYGPPDSSCATFQIEGN